MKQTASIGEWPWYVLGFLGLGLVLIPASGPAPASGWPLSYILQGWIRLFFAAPTLYLGLGVAPLFLLGVIGRTPGLAMGLTVAPLIWAMVGGGVLAAGGDFSHAGRIAIALAALTCFAAGLAGRRQRSVQIRTGARLSTAVWLPAVTLVLVLGVLFLANPILASRSDAWFHAAVTYRMDAVGWPPDDPYFVGIPLGYFWAFHLALGTLSGAAGVTPFVAGATISLAASLAVALWLGLLARRLSGKRASAFALFLAVIAVNPLGWIAWLARGTIGETRGVEVLSAAWNGGTIGALEAISIGYPHPSVGFFADKFLLVTALGLGFAAFLGLAWTLVAGSRASSVQTFARVLLASTTALFLHAVVGAAVLAAFLPAVILGAALAPQSRKHFLTFALGIFVGALAALPYLILCSSARSAPALGFGLNVPMMWTWAVAGGLLVALAFPEVRRWLGESERRWQHWVFLSLIAVLAVASMGMQIYPNNETKLFNLGVLLLAVPAAGGWVLVRKTRLGLWLSTAALVVAIPTVLLATAGFLAERGSDMQGSPKLDTHEAEAYQWLAAYTDPRAVVVEATRDPSGTLGLDALIHARRALLWGGPQYARAWGYPSEELEVRLGLASTLGRETLRPDQELYLRKVARENPAGVYFLCRKSGEFANPQPTLRNWESVFENPGLIIFEYRSESSSERESG